MLGWDNFTHPLTKFRGRECSVGGDGGDGSGDDGGGSGGGVGRAVIVWPKRVGLDWEVEVLMVFVATFITLYLAMLLLVVDSVCSEEVMKLGKGVR